LNQIFNTEEIDFFNNFKKVLDKTMIDNLIKKIGIFYNQNNNNIIINDNKANNLKEKFFNYKETTLNLYLGNYDSINYYSINHLIILFGNNLFFLKKKKLNEIFSQNLLVILMKKLKKLTFQKI